MGNDEYQYLWSTELGLNGEKYEKTSANSIKNFSPRIHTGYIGNRMWEIYSKESKGR